MSNSSYDVNFNSSEFVENYDNVAQTFIISYETIQRLNYAFLKKEFPGKATILIPGCGTGSDIILLAKHNPEWSFVALDPSKYVIDIAERRFEKEGIKDQVRLLETTFEAFENKEIYDGVISTHVLHMLSAQEQIQYINKLSDVLKQNGISLVYTGFYDETLGDFENTRQIWSLHAKANGAEQAAIDEITQYPLNYPERLSKKDFFEAEFLKCGFKTTQIFQVPMYIGWILRK